MVGWWQQKRGAGAPKEEFYSKEEFTGEGRDTRAAGLQKKNPWDT